MIQIAQLTPDGDGAVPALIETNGRCYPSYARKSLSESRLARVRRAKRTNDGLADRISEQLRKQFTMDLNEKTYSTNEDLLQAYSKDVGVIRKACDDVRGAFRLLYRLNTQLALQQPEAGRSASADDETLKEAQYRSWSKGLDEAISVGDFGLSVRLTKLLVEHGPQALEQRRGECLDDFIRQIDEMLDKMVGYQHVGLIEFGPDRDCSFHFFRDALIEFQSNTWSIRPVETRHTVQEELTRRVVEVTGAHADGIRTRSKVCRTRQDIYLREVEVALFGHSRMPILPAINDFLCSLPDWLRESIRIVEGDRYEQHFYDYEIEEVNWETTRVRPFHTHVVEKIHRDPALTLGNYVLAGWDCSEMSDELSQRAEQWREVRRSGDADLGRLRAGSMLIAAVIALVIAVLGFSMLPGIVARIAGAAGATAFTACAVGAFHFVGRAKHKRLNSVHHTLAAILSGTAAISVLFGVHAFRSGQSSLLWAIVAPVALLLSAGLVAVLPEEKPK